MTPPADLSALVAELRKLEDAATPWPWRHELGVGSVQSQVVFDGTGYLFGQIDDPGNAKLTVAMRNALPQLLAAAEERDALRAALETLRKAGEEEVYALTCGDRQADVLDVFCKELGDAEKALGRGT